MTDPLDPAAAKKMRIQGSGSMQDKILTTANTTFSLKPQIWIKKLNISEYLKS